ncbi:hypothetical protein D6783_02400 [Candidatus Woesearchaeota archaeon]|nr:MAG: hypothetical protein D6783_02400 [Candidatus Woesearchaeota archaeon]
MVDHVKRFVTNSVSSELEFFPAVAQAFRQFNEGNRSPLYRLLCVTNGKKAEKIRVIEGEKLPFAPHLKRLIEYAAEGFEYKDFKYNPSLPLGISLKVSIESGGNAGFNTEVIEQIENLSGKTVRSKEYKEAFPPIKKEKPEKPILEIAEGYIKRLGDEKARLIALAILELEKKKESADS